MGIHPQGDDAALYWAVRSVIDKRGYGQQVMGDALLHAPQPGPDGQSICVGCKPPLPWPCETFDALAVLCRIKDP